MCYNPNMVSRREGMYVGLLSSLLLAMLMPTARGSLLGSNLFPADNPWNQNISQAPVATNSTAIMTNIVAKYGNGRFHPDFGQDYRLASDPLYGIP